jgi:hypothetical protein
VLPREERDLQRPTVPKNLRKLSCPFLNFQKTEEKVAIRVSTPVNGRTRVSQPSGAGQEDSHECPCTEFS